MGNQNSSVNSFTDVNPETVEDLISRLEQLQQYNHKYPVAPNDNDDQGEHQELAQLSVLLKSVYDGYPDLLHGEATNRPLPLTFPPELLAEIKAECKEPIPDDASEEERKEIEKLRSILTDLQSFQQPLKPWSGDFPLSVNDISIQFLSQLLQSQVRDYVVKEIAQKRQPYRQFHVSVEYLEPNVTDSWRPDQLVLQVPDLNYLDSHGSAASREFNRELTFARECQDEIPLHVPRVFGVWDDGHADRVQRFLIAFHDEGYQDHHLNQNQTLPTLQTKNMGLSHYKTILRELAQYHAYFFDHAMVVSLTLLVQSQIGTIVASLFFAWLTIVSRTVGGC